MKKQITTILLVLVCFSGFAQVTFDKGYYINNNNQKTEGLIKNIDWLNNPTSFEFKSSEDAKTLVLSIKEVKEFGVNNFSKYRRFKVNIDKSSDSAGELSSRRGVTFTEEELFLKVLVEGNATLYSYKSGNLSRFFFEKENVDTQQLIYKRYLVTASQIGKNNRYQQQLWNNLKCSRISLKDIEKINYKENKLIDFFIKYNNCSNSSEFISFKRDKKEAKTNISLRAGLTNSNIAINQLSVVYNNDKFNVLEYRFGIEMEHVLGFNRNKWALLVEPIYQSFSTTKTFPTRVGAAPEYELSIDYSSIDVAVGVRHFLFLKNDSKLFLNALLNIHLSGNVEPLYNDIITNIEYEIDSSNFVLGTGYKHKEKYSIELRYETRKAGNNFINKGPNYKSNMLSIIFGYKLF